MIMFKFGISIFSLEVQAEAEVRDTVGFHKVSFSYGSTDQKNPDVAMDIPSFRPPFPVPESLFRNLPPSEKLHQIIARTAIFVSKHGGQSEIVLRVKQGDNPTFGFLMPHHNLHPYFRYLVDHPELLKADNDGKSQDEKTDNQTNGALSLLGSVYGSGEDDDGGVEVHREQQKIDSTETLAVDDMSKFHQLGNVTQNDEKFSKHLDPPKVKAAALSKNHICKIKPAYANGLKKDGDIVCSTGRDMDKSKVSGLFPVSKVETSLVDPPSEVKRLVDRIVEIILKNGKDFEAVLIEQDKKRRKFPFLLPSNQYHPYYLKVLKKAQETRLSGKSFGSEKDGSSWQETDPKTSSFKDSEHLSSGELPLDYDRKEKFKMVITKTKKDQQDQPSKETHQQCGITVDAAAAILEAATRGTRNPNLDIFSKTSSSVSLQTSQTESSAQKKNENKNKKARVSVPVAKEIAKTAAIAAAGEADSSEAGLTRDKKLKAERLRRAKMFAAMIKSGSAPLGTVDPPGNGVSASATSVANEEAKENEGNSFPVEAWGGLHATTGEAGISDKMWKLKRNSSDDDHEQKSVKRRHYRSRKLDDSERESEEENEGKKQDEDEEAEEGRRRSRKKRGSRRSSRHHRDRSKDRHKRRTKHSSKSKESRHHHKHESSEGEDRSDRHNRYKHHENSSSDDGEYKHRKRRHKHETSSDDERKHRKRKSKRTRKDEERCERRSRKEDERSHEDAELEEGEIRTKSSDRSPSIIGDNASREASVGVSETSYPQKRTPSLPPSETTEVPDELRAKIRAMLLATM